jgi:hypothetical protein
VRMEKLLGTAQVAESPPHAPALQNSRAPKDAAATRRAKRLLLVASTCHDPPLAGRLCLPLNGRMVRLRADMLVLSRVTCRTGAVAQRD